MSFVNQTTATGPANQPLAGLPDYLQAGLIGATTPGQPANSGPGGSGAGSDPRYVDPRLAPPAMQRYREMTIDELLLENRIVFLVGEINHATATGVIMRLLYLQNSKPGIDINLYINSPGGAVDDTLAIIDTMQFISAEVATYCIGKAMSGGAIILAAGQKGKRYALPHAKVMIHQPYGGIYGQTSDVQIQAEEILKTKDQLNQMLADLTGQSIDQIAEDSERDKFFSADDAKNYGIVDDVIKKGPEQKKPD
ncbi:MAG: ATP-dependent Clp protease proteolytic subunit [Planctomycetes bacterium]|jgi:ATP-dependent Clp protease protease subunit|nr:ATP-dependent Clp protease proteolytic subunit [Planctomycetota bacterium]